jgi:hypothetical protein
VGWVWRRPSDSAMRPLGERSSEVPWFHSLLRSLGMKSPAETQNMRRSGPAVRARRRRHGAFHDPTSWKQRFYSCRHDTRPPERPSGSQDARGLGIDSDCGAVLLPRAHRGNSPRKTACRLSSAHHRRAPSSASWQRGFFVGARAAVCRRNIHNGSQGRDRQGQGDLRCLRTRGQMS